MEGMNILSGRAVCSLLDKGGVRGVAVAVVLLFASVILSLSKEASAATVNLPKTGQQTCYDSSGTVISCGGTGQDGDWKAGVAAAGQRFTPGAGATAACVTDNLTGLMWVKAPDSTTRSWQTALDYVKTVNASGGLCGFTDWRVPSIVELETVVNAEQPSPAAWLNTQGFSNIQSGYYWSSSTSAYYTGYAWAVYVDGGVVDGVGKTNGGYVWPVRGGQ